MTAPFENLVDLLETRAQSFAHRPLFGTKAGGAWRWITFDEFRKDVDRLRGAFGTMGVRPGDRVAIISKNSVEWALAAYATYSSGAAFVPMYESQVADEWEFILKDSGAKVVVASTRVIGDQLAPMKRRLPQLERVIGVGLHEADPDSFRSLLVRGGGTPVPLVRPAREDVGNIVYTSGTTGKPKGVLLTHDNVCTNVGALLHLFPYTPDERSLAFLPWAHVFGQTCELHTSIALGTSMALNDDLARLLDNLLEVRPTVLYAVPRVFNRIYDGVKHQMASRAAPIRALFAAGMAAATRRTRGVRLGAVEAATLRAADRLIFSRIRARFGGRLKWVISGSAALSPEVAEFIDALGIEVYEGYGLTETSPVATTNYPGHRKIGSVGKAIAGVRIEIDREVTSDPRIGEIVVHGPNVMRGYHERPEENAAVFSADGGLRTGDLGYLDSDGYLFVTGRIKEQYKLENGKYVVPGPLEEALKLSPFVAHAMLFGANKPHNVVLVVVDKDALAKWATDRGITVHDIPRDDRVQELVSREIDRLAAPFKSFERPERFLIVADDFTVENGMLTPTLKLKRGKVAERYGSALEGLY